MDNNANTNTNDDAPTQRSRDWITNAAPNEVADALAGGELNAVLNGQHVTDEAEPKIEQIKRDQLRNLTPGEIVKAYAEGRLVDVLNGVGAPERHYD